MSYYYKIAIVLLKFHKLYSFHFYNLNFKMIFFLVYFDLSGSKRKSKDNISCSMDTESIFFKKRRNKSNYLIISSLQGKLKIFLGL